MKGGYTAAGTVFKICPASMTGINSNEKFNNEVGQNYPNPTNGTTQIDYSVSDVSNVTLELYDVTGRKVKSIINSSVTPGAHTIQINDADRFADGSYFYKIEVKQNNKIVYTETKRMIIAK
jgi:hypothetical protein